MLINITISGFDRLYRSSLLQGLQYILLVLLAIQRLNVLIKINFRMLSSNEKNALRWHLQVIFLYYASYADRNNYKLLKTQNYRRFLIDSQTVIDQPSFPPFDIAFRKIHSTAITHQQFQELIPNIAQLAFRSLKRKEAFEAYISNNLQKLYNEILHKSDFGADVLAIQSLQIEVKSLHTLQSVALKKAYIKYIQSTCMHQKNPEQTFEHLHVFLSQFQISPKLIYKAMTYLVFFYLLRTKTNQTKYQLEDLKKILICIAELHWRRVDGSEAHQEQKIFPILQQMELSAGFKKMVDKSLKQSAVLVSFFKRTRPNRLQTQQDQLNLSNSKIKKHESTSKHPQTTKSQKYNSFYFGSAKKSERKEDLGTVRDLIEFGEAGFDVKQLKYTFERLCTQGEVANIKTLKSIKIKKYFQSVNILIPLSQSWLDLKVADLCRSSPSGKIQFPHFLQLLFLASKQLSITLQSLYQYLVMSSPQQQSGVKTAYSTKQRKGGEGEKSALGIFYQVQKQLQKIFLHYSQNKKELVFQKLTHLLYDFDIFPAFISKSKLYKIFQQFSHSKNQLMNLVGQVYINLEGFFQLLNAISREVGQNLIPEEEVLFMLERMQDSQGHRTILGSQGANLIGDLRARYSSIYLNALKRNSEEEQVGFEQLIEGSLSLVKDNQ